MSATVIDHPAYVAELQNIISLQMQASKKSDEIIDGLRRIERGHETVIYNLLFAIGRHLNGDDGPLHKAINDACTALSFSNHLPPQG
jgi:hypothetical protein